GLLAFGLMSIYSEGLHRDGLANFKRQLINTAIGIGPFLLMRKVDPRRWQKVWALLYGLMLALLVATLVLGKGAKGAERWIDIGPIQFQPSEVAKLLIILTLSSYFAHRTDRLTSFGTFIGSLAHV